MQQPVESHNKIFCLKFVQYPFHWIRHAPQSRCQKKREIWEWEGQFNHGEIFITYGHLYICSFRGIDTDVHTFNSMENSLNFKSLQPSTGYICQLDFSGVLFHIQYHHASVLVINITKWGNLQTFIIKLNFYVKYPVFIRFAPSNIWNKTTANGTKYARQIFKEAIILTFD
jgi:hypothetical protein